MKKENKPNHQIRVGKRSVRLPIMLVVLSTVMGGCRPTSDLFPFDNNFKNELSQQAIDLCLKDNPSVTRADCDLKNYLSSPLTLLALQDLLLSVSKIFDELNISYFVESGTAIGAGRFDAHLAWDDDVDLGVFAETFDEHARKAFTEKIYDAGLEFKPLIGIAGIDSLMGRQGLSQVAYRKSRFAKLVLSALPTINPTDLENLWLRYERGMSFLPQLDVFIWDETRPGHYTYRASHFSPQVMKEHGLPKELFLSEVNILGTKFKGISNLSAYGEIAYGTSNLLTDFYVSREHQAGATLRFPHIRKHRESLEFLVNYLEYVYTLPAAKNMGIVFEKEKILTRFGF